MNCSLCGGLSHTNLHCYGTSEQLLEDLCLAAKKYGDLSSEDRFEQKVSFIYGQMGSDRTVTKEQIREQLRRG